MFQIWLCQTGGKKPFVFRLLLDFSQPKKPQSHVWFLAGQSKWSVFEPELNAADLISFGLDCSFWQIAKLQ